MFRIEFFVEDKHFAEVMHALANRALDIKWQPVANAVARKGKVEAITKGSSLDMFVERLKGMTTFGKPEVEAILKAIHLKPTSYIYMVNRAIAAGHVRRVGKPMTGKPSVYEVVK